MMRMKRARPHHRSSTAAWMLEIGVVLMRTETELILKSRRVVPTRLHESGFAFEFPHWPEAADDLCRRWRASHKAAITR